MARSHTLSWVVDLWLDLLDSLVTITSYPESTVSSPTVAILGASSNREKFGNISVRAHVQAGYEVYPINPREDSIEELTAYPTLSDLPVDEVDRISVYLPPKILLTVLDEIAAFRHRELWLNPGTESPEVSARAKELGLRPTIGCSIVDLGISPADVR